MDAVRAPSLLARTLARCGAIAALLLLLGAHGERALAQHSSENPALEQPAAAERARALEGRLRAPCCWTQTLDTHDSEVVRELRREILARVHAGEPSQQIEDDLIARYGERLRAVPVGNPLNEWALTVALVIAAAGAGLFLLARRWRDAGLQAARSDELRGESDEYDEQLRRELAELS